MTASDILFTCLAFFIIGFLVVAIGLFFCRIKCIIKKKQKNFKSPAKFVPKIDLSYQKPPSSIDNSSAVNSFVKK
jgi:hypothetical protein